MSKKTLNKTNLEALGADKLAELLIEVSSGSADIKRRLRLELSHNLGASELARDVRKRLVSLRKSTSYVGWRKRKALIKDLSTQVSMIVDKISPEDPNEAFELLWQFIEIAPSVYERVDDSRGDVGDVFRSARARFEDIIPRVVIAPDVLAERVWAVVLDNGYGEWDGIIPLMAPLLGASGLERLKSLTQAYAEAPLEDDDDEDHDAIRFLRQLRGGANYAAERKARFVQWCLQEIAATAGDTTAYIAQYSPEDLKRKDVSAEVATLLIGEERAEEALDLLRAARQGGHTFGQEAWDEAYIACLIALGRMQDAQAHRWVCFSSTLSAHHLRDFIKELPDFDDVEAEEQAKTLVLAFPDFSTALEFCIDWQDLFTAARLIETRTDEIDGNNYFLLPLAAEALRVRYPRAAVVLWRALIDFSLDQGRSSRYGHAAEHLADCASVDVEIPDYGPFRDHESYIQTLRSRHERKSSFWAKVR